VIRASGAIGRRPARRGSATRRRRSGRETRRFTPSASSLAAAGWPDLLHARIGHPVVWIGGLIGAPVQLAVFTDTGLAKGRGRGRQTMPSALEQSTAIAIHTLWLTARAHGIGLGMVSILDPARMAALFAASPRVALHDEHDEPVPRPPGFRGRYADVASARLTKGRRAPVGGPLAPRRVNRSRRPGAGSGAF